MDRHLRAACFVIAASGGVFALASLAFAALRPAVVPVTWIVGGAGTVLFVRMLLSRTNGRGIETINREMQGDAPWPGRSIRFRDPEWGLFGRRCGSPAVLWLRAVLLCGWPPLVLLAGMIGEEVGFLWSACLFVAIELTIMHAVATLPRTPA
ncbi:hypothetical protein [Erythrobacter sp.]|uniref:hypothetical protein n=1 Tax=Erythrobacter sp. TaxID=1042 RepID=UPI0025E50625|nr:hypothetical protein [Erythrobacter sp.]